MPHAWGGYGEALTADSSRFNGASRNLKGASAIARTEPRALNFKVVVTECRAQARGLQLEREGRR